MGSGLTKKRKVITYEVYIQTGDRLGAGTKANVKITIFGEYGNTGERQLLRSKTHRSKFQRGQVDVFVIDSLFLGKVLSIRVGHNETRLGYGWFLDKVYIKEGVEATRAFEFRCNRWFSSKDDDGQVMRDMPVYDAVPASHVTALLPKVEVRQEDHFYSPSDSETTKSEGEETPRESEQRARETTTYSKAKARSKHKAKSTNAKPVVEPLDQEDGFKAMKAENLFDVSEDENEPEEDRFFEPNAEASESENSDEEKVVNRKLQEQAKRQPEKTVERFPNKKTQLIEKIASEEEEEQDQEEEEEEEEKEDKESPEASEESRSSEEDQKKKNGLRSKGVRHLRLITTAISPFLTKRRTSPPEPKPSPITEEPVEETVPKTEPEATTKKAEQEDDEPAVEFTPSEPKKTERPSSAHSDEFEEGFRAGIGKKQQEERTQHRMSITESENVFRTGASIHEAAKKGDLARIKELLQVAPAMKSTVDEKGMTALHIASSNGHLDCVKWLAVSGVDLGEETPTGYTAIHLAAMGGHVNCMMILSAMGSEINFKTIDELTPLHLAAMSGHLECVKWLLANRAKLNAEDSNGRTSLDIAEEYGHEAIVKLLKKFKKELTRQDSTLAQLMKTEKRRKSMDSIASDNEGAPSKVSDSGVGGMGSEEENWISDTEEDASEESMKNTRPDTAPKAHSSDHERPSSASRNRTDSIASAEEKKKLFEKQRKKMRKRNSSFLDSIRMDVENDEEDF